MKHPKLTKLENLSEQIQKLAEQKRIAEQDYKEYVQKTRLRRISKRGAMIESILPETVEFTDTQLKKLLEMTLLSGYARKRIEEMMSGKPLTEEPAAVKTVPSAPTAVKSTPAETDTADYKAQEETT